MKVTINFSKRWLYTFIAIGILAIIGVGVYAWANPITGVGHSHDEIEPCADGQILEMSGGVWSCGSDDEGSNLWTESGSNIYRSSGNVGIGTTNPLSKLSVGGGGILIKSKNAGLIGGDPPCNQDNDGLLFHKYYASIPPGYGSSLMICGCNSAGSCSWHMIKVW